MVFPVESSSFGTSADVDWGDWSLGDLVEVIRRTADLLGSGTSAIRIHVEPPTGDLRLPKATVLVKTDDTVAGLADRVLSDEGTVRFCGNSFGGGWVAQVDDIELHVAPEPATWR